MKKFKCFSGIVLNLESVFYDWGEMKLIILLTQSAFFIFHLLFQGW